MLLHLQAFYGSRRRARGRGVDSYTVEKAIVDFKIKLKNNIN